MAYYSNTIEIFLKDIESGSIFNILENFKNKNTEEFKSWKKSLPELAKILSLLENKTNLYIFIEYHLKFIDKRIDVLLVGKNCSIVIELKQWTIRESIKDFIIPNHDLKEYIHPTLQAKEYSQSLIDFFYGSKGISSLYCSYLHNIDTEIQNNLLLNCKKFSEYSFSKITKNKFRDFLYANLVSFEIEKSKEKGLLKCLIEKQLIPTPSIIDYVNNLMNDDFSINIIDKQRVFYSKVLQNKNRQNNIFILDGRAGSGKTVVGYKLLVELIKLKKNVVLTIPSSFLYHTSKHNKFPIFHSYSITQNNTLYDFIIVDEAHRLTKQELVELSNKCKNLILLIDDFQKISAKGINVDDIKKQLINKTIIYEKLRFQLRSKGQNFYEDWVYNLFINPTLYKNTNEFSVSIFDNINILENELNNYTNKKLIAGFTWEWNEPKSDGSLPLDIYIEKDAWSKAWNNKNLLKTKNYKSFYLDNSLNEVACIYTAQGIEYDYIGLILGSDIDYQNGKFIYLPQNYKDKDKPTEIEIRNIYITLMTRAKKGLLVYAVNDNVTKRLKELIK